MKGNLMHSVYESRHALDRILENQRASPATKDLLQNFHDRLNRGLVTQSTETQSTCIARVRSKQ